MGTKIGFVYCTKEEYLKRMEEAKQASQVEESSTTSQEDVESSDSK